MTRQARILLPPGIGDIHWCMLRLRGLLRAWERDEKPALVSVASINQRYDRSADYLRMLPFVEFEGYFQMATRPLRIDFWNAANNCDQLTNWNGFDQFLCVNRHIELGQQIEQILPAAGAADWDYPIRESTIADSKLPSRPFIEVTFYQHGHYGEWWQHSNPPQIILSLLDQSNCDLVLTGAEWDAEALRPLIALDPKRIHDCVGQTSLGELFALKRRSSGFVGHPSGSGIMSQHFRVPTVMLWGEHPRFTEGMRTCWVRPDMRGGRHRAMDIRSKPVDVVENLMAAMESNG